MSDPIREAIAAGRPTVEGAGWQDDIHAIIKRFATPSLYLNLSVSEKMRKELVRYYAKELVAQANLAGLRTAKPILRDIGSPITAVRGRALRELNGWTANAVKAFQEELNLAHVTLRGETRVAFFRAKRDVAGFGNADRKQLASDLAKASKADMAAKTKGYNRIRSARTKLAKAEKVGNTVTVKAARVELLKAKAAVKKTDDLLGRFEKAVQASARDGARRQMAAAQKAQYQQSLGKDVKRYWVTVNGSQACPTCEDRHMLLVPDETGGEPGSGQTYCGASCQCHAVPKIHLDGTPIPKPIVA